MLTKRRVMAISGGVGGAKLALGLSVVLDPRELLIVANTGDDFEHLGLPICPDIDTLMYTLAGVADPQRGWGLAGESWHCLEALRGLDGPHWFALGDRDLATHLRRAELLRNGATLTAATARLCAALGVRHAIVPMSDDPVRTIVETDRGRLAFQEYFVREQCAPVVRRVLFEGGADARPSAAIADWLAPGSDCAVLICPSNPFLSVDPVLAVPGIRERLATRPVVAVSPIVGGRALKGPAAKMMAELGLQASALDVARHYRGLVNGFVIDTADAADAAAIRALGMEVLVTDTIMGTIEDKRRLATEAIDLLYRIAT